MADYFWMLVMCTLFISVLTAIYWGYRKTDALLASLPNCTTLIARAALWRDRGVIANAHLMMSIAMTVTYPRFMSLSDVVSMEDLGKLPRSERIKLALLVYAMLGSLALLAGAWLISKLTNYFNGT
ncbi:hypothetical protein V0R50_15930 [Pseudomonas sp. 148P]|uniref:Uncharacterized protein n=1 Tax=Pseudomonas ulcerans TaxID=3115852 RepID=A0ABU7HT67_9PSED|nr:MULTISPECIES: hypothetical protein [unclassified Pseudomonas]MEE1924946.1 hypothetical protein [Pseudomonas sp. 147P]MEE1934719.1 hypothetical protein [Pseudomonas sp. 148P]